ncbi:MAG: hypothetical protein OEO83_14525 [Alphaproteobacteria bacterium]|nr:hypothetical protein [Alphaproteobacteria bacterium]
MDENDLFAALKLAIAAGRVSVRFDYKRLNHQDSPLCVEADSNRWIYGIMAATLAAGFLVVWWAGVAALIIGVALYWGIGRNWVRRRMEGRFHNRILEDIGLFKKLWRIHGVTLALTSRPVLCHSPGGNWRRFVMQNLAGDGPDAP